MHIENQQRSKHSQPTNQFQVLNSDGSDIKFVLDSNDGNGYISHDKLSYAFSVWRMEGAWNKGMSNGHNDFGSTASVSSISVCSNYRGLPNSDKSETGHVRPNEVAVFNDKGLSYDYMTAKVLVPNLHNQTYGGT